MAPQAIVCLRNQVQFGLVTDYPLGKKVHCLEPALMPTGEPLLGRFVRLGRPVAERDSTGLFAATHGTNSELGQWTYMSFGPFADADEMTKWLAGVQDLTDPLFMVVCDSSSGEPIGMVSYLNIVRQHRTIELGNIWYAPVAQRTAANTEAMFLLLSDCFDNLGFRRVEWKCDRFNERSIVSALRLGFSFEGIFKQHFIVNGRNRDTAWFAMIDADWQSIKKNYEEALYNADCAESLAKMNAPFVHAGPPDK